MQHPERETHREKADWWSPGVAEKEGEGTALWGPGLLVGR